MTPSQETSPEPFPHEERAMDRLLDVTGAPRLGPRLPEVRVRRPRRGWHRTSAVMVGAVAGLALLTQAGVSAAGATAAGACASASSGRHVALVVQHGDGRTLSRCVPMSGTTMTGEQILKASGVEYQVQSFGSLGDAACQVDHEPASYTQCLPSTGSYWALFVSTAGAAWQSASKGISEQTFAAGDALGLRYDPESASSAAPPSVAPPAVCTPALGCGAASGTPAGHPSPGSGVSGALIGALAVAAVLVVLLAIQLVARRRRASPLEG
jgi:hypothetical protein